METCLDIDNVLLRYEGTGRSLSLKLLEQLRQQSAPGAKPASGGDVALIGRTLHECELKESIRLFEKLYGELTTWLTMLIKVPKWRPLRVLAEPASMLGRYKSQSWRGDSFNSRLQSLLHQQV